MSVALISADDFAEPLGRQRGRQGHDPAALAARMMEEFDKNGSNKLNSDELLASMTSLREQHGSGLGGAGAERRMGKVSVQMLPVKARKELISLAAPNVKSQGVPI